VKETSIASSYRRVFPPIPPVGMTIGPVGKLSVAEPEPEAEAEEEPDTGGSEIDGTEIEPTGMEDPEGADADADAEGTGMDGNEMVGMLA
jgi:hypothetical protein